MQKEIYELADYDGKGIYPQTHVTAVVGNKFLDITEYNSGATYSDVSAAAQAVPQDFRYTGMTLSFIQSGNPQKYVKYILTSTTWSTDASNWSYCGDDVLNTQVELLAAGVKVTLKFKSSVIYKGENQPITMSGETVNAIADEMKLLYGDTVLATSGSTDIIEHTMTVNQTENSRTYRAQGLVKGMILHADASISARYPIWYGFATNKDTVTQSGTRRGATTSAAGTYTRTASVSGQHFYILVPSDISGLNNFVMNGAPFVMKLLPESATISGISYKAYESGYTYDSGTKLEVVASYI